MIEIQEYCDGIISLLEGHAFLFGEPAEVHRLEEVLRQGVTAEVACESDRSVGRLRLTCPLALGQEIVSNTVGDVDDHEALRSLIEDSLGELANVVAGRLLALSVGEEQVYRLAAPQVRPCTRYPNPEPGKEILTLDVEDHLVTMEWLD